MENKEEFSFKDGVVGYPLLFILLIWIVFWVEIKLDISFNDFGVNPRTLKGLRGIIFSPFIHSDLKHLWNNTLPLLVLTIAFVLFLRKSSLESSWIWIVVYGNNDMDFGEACQIILVQVALFICYLDSYSSKVLLANIID